VPIDVIGPALKAMGEAAADAGAPAELESATPGALPEATESSSRFVHNGEAAADVQAK